MTQQLNQQLFFKGGYLGSRSLCFLLFHLCILLISILTQTSHHVSSIEESSSIPRHDLSQGNGGEICSTESSIIFQPNIVMDKHHETHKHHTPSDEMSLTFYNLKNLDDDTLQQPDNGHTINSIFIHVDDGNFTQVVTQSCQKDNPISLILLVFYTSTCLLQNNILLETIEQAASTLESEIISQNERFRMANVGWESSLRPPLYVKMNVDALSDPKSYLHHWLQRFDLGSKDIWPQIRLLQMEDVGGVYNGNNIEESISSDRYQLHSISFLGSTESSQDIVDGIMHYLCRLCLSAYYYVDEVNNNNNNNDESMNHLEQDSSSTSTNLPAHLFPSRLSVFAFSTEESFYNFLQITKRNLFHNVSQELAIVNESEEAFFRKMTLFEKDELKDPFLAFIQCRSSSDPSHPQLTWYDDFEALAEVFIHRRDVAFFIFVTQQPQQCQWFINKIMLEGDDNDNNYVRMDGAVGIIKFHPSLKTEHYQDRPYSYLGATYFPRTSTNESDVSMRNFIVFHSTPSVLYHDRFTSTVWAFHMKRKVHVCLFIDAHAPSVLNETDLFQSLERSQVAVKALRKVSLNRKKTHPQEDVVFLTIPSTEIRVMRTFGIDIWSPMDDVMMGNLTVGDVLYNTLPKLVITSRNESVYYTKRYILEPDDFMNCTIYNTGCDSQFTENAMNQFVTNVLNGMGTHDIKSQIEPVHRENDSGVITLTGHSFHNLMNNLTRNTLIQFYAPWCGHCKRFQVIWNKLARLVRYCNMQSFLDVMKIDVSENDVYHPLVDIQDIPSVYFFSKQYPKPPIRLNIAGDKLSPNTTVLKSPKDILNWIVSNGKIDHDELLQLLKI